MEAESPGVAMCCAIIALSWPVVDNTSLNWMTERECIWMASHGG